jgi:hypothetical protein
MRVSVTSNIDKFRKNFDKAIQRKKATMNKAVYSIVLSAFEVILDNSPVDSSQFLQNWHVYKHGGQRGYTPLIDYEMQRHERYDYSGRMETKALAMPEHMAVIESELMSMGLDFFAKGRKQVTVGLSNKTPYGDMLNEGLYEPIPPLVNLTSSGYSIQAPYGIIDVSMSTVAMDMPDKFGQFLSVGGA